MMTTCMIPIPIYLAEAYLITSLWCECLLTDSFRNRLAYLPVSTSFRRCPSPTVGQKCHIIFGGGLNWFFNINNRYDSVRQKPDCPLSFGMQCMISAHMNPITWFKLLSALTHYNVARAYNVPSILLYTKILWIWWPSISCSCSTGFMSHWNWMPPFRAEMQRSKYFDARHKTGTTWK